MISRLLTIYFDYISPFAYLAAEILPELAERHALALEWKPIELQGLSSFEGGLPYSPQKRVYVAVDAQRAAAFHGIEIRTPKPFPVESSVARAVALVAAEHDRFDAIHRALFRAAWRDQRDLGSPSVLADCIEAAGGSADAWLAEARKPRIRQRVESFTAEAEAAGVFGVPTAVLDGELFWGIDSFPALEWRLRGGAPAGPGGV